MTRDLNGETGQFQFSYGVDTARRTSIINHLAKNIDAKSYLEIGVRNPASNFNNIKIASKTAVDPCPRVIQDNIVVATSDDFFSDLPDTVRYDIIFIDGLHLEYQVDRDIQNARNHLAVGGYVIMHDCNPPTEFHQREEYEVDGGYPSWNGTTWRSYVKRRITDTGLTMIVVDTDWGVGVLQEGAQELYPFAGNPVELRYEDLENDRTRMLNLISVEAFLQRFPATP